MMELPLSKIRKILLRKKAGLEKQIKELDKEDPFKARDRSVLGEPASDALELTGHERVAVIRSQLEKVLNQTRRALSLVGIGKYGRCEICGKLIETERLQIKPEATLCLSCERKKESSRL